MDAPEKNKKTVLCFSALVVWRKKLQFMLMFKAVRLLNCKVIIQVIAESDHEEKIDDVVLQGMLDEVGFSS